jgi:hypothetical protein
VNPTGPRHRMLTAVSNGSVAWFHDSWQWGDDEDRHMIRSDAATLSGLFRAGQIQTGFGSAWRPVLLTDSGAVLLSEWNARFGEVRP